MGMDKKHLGYIGLFWYNNSKKKLITVKESLDNDSISIDKSKDSEYYVIGSHAHFTTWTDKVKKENGGVDYRYYPRGRVVYYPATRKFRIFTDKCIPINVISQIKKSFLLGNTTEVVDSQGYDDKVNRLAKSGHYTCHICRGESL